MHQRNSKSAHVNSINHSRNSSSKKINQTNNTKTVVACFRCNLVSICDKTRILCPYCGSFFDSKKEKLHERADQTKNDRRPSLTINNNKNNLLLSPIEPKHIEQHRSRVNSVTSIDRNENSSANSESNSDSDSNKDHNKQFKLKNFFINLVHFKSKNSNSNPNLVKQQDAGHFRMAKNEHTHSLQNNNFLHRFLAINNKDILEEYRENSVVKSQNEFRNLYKQTIESGNYEAITDFYVWIFSKSSHLIELLVAEKHHQSSTNKNNNEDTVGLRKYDASFYVTANWRFMKEIYNCLVKMPDHVIDQTQKSISFCIAYDLRPMIDDMKSYLMHQKENEVDFLNIDKKIVEIVYGYLILLCNPLLDSIENNPLFSLILSSLASLAKQTQNSLIYALRKMPLNLFRDILIHVQNFLLIRFMPKQKIKLVPLITDWLTSSVKFMAILYITNEMQIQYYQNHYSEYVTDALNHLKEKEKYLDKDEIDELERPESSAHLVSASTTSSSLFVSYKEFYLKELDFIDLYREYYKWQRIGDSPIGFSFCQYPFLLSINAKMKILEKDSEHQMLLKAKQSYLNSDRIRNNLEPNSADLFLTLRIRRNNIIADSLNEIEMKKSNLKKKLRVNFIGEAAVDMGGVRKEWFLLLVRKIFSPVYGMFTYIKESNVFWFSTSSESITLLAEYNLIGVLMGLAVYNSEILDIHFPSCVFKKLAVLDPVRLSAEMPENENANIGVSKSLTLYDLRLVMPGLASSLQQLLEYEGNVKDDFMLKFVVSYTEFDIVRTIELKENGENIDLTNENRKEYVDLYIDFLLNKSIYRQFKAFYQGFHSVCESNAIILFRPEEIELLVCGSPDILNINELKKVATYENYSEKDEIICWFWEIFKEEFDLNQKRRLLLFTTGSDRIPIGGAKDMQFKIIRLESKNQLPMAHTCFNQLLLPHYSEKEILKSKMLIAIENAEGFGFK